MSQNAAVLFANDAFYTAFRLCDVAAMDALWAERHAVACIHPGWQALIGRDAVMASWRSILADLDAPEVICRQPRVILQDSTAMVICYEVIGSTALVATNVFVREGRLWKLSHHQAGPCPLDAEAFEDEGEDEDPPLQ